MTREEKFLTTSKEKYNNKFDYSKFIYKNAKTKGFIICPIHGEFQQHPELHLKSIYGCPECSKIGRGKTCSTQYKNGTRSLKRLQYNQDVIYSKLKKLFNDLEFDMSNYNGIVGNKIKVICQEHGESYCLPNNILKSVAGCPLCGRASARKKMTNSYDEIIKKFHRVHNNKYKYLDTFKEEYTNLKNSMFEIKCDKHGIFTKIGNRHMKGHGCFECLCDDIRKDGRRPGGYNEKNFAKSDKLKNKAAIIYYFKIGEYYKIGITINLKSRIAALKNKSKKNVEIIFSKNMRLYDAYLLEQKLLKKYKNKRVMTEWSTELFLENVICEGELNLSI